MIDPGLLQYAQTDVQRRTVQACIDGGSYANAADILKRHRNKVIECVGRVRRQAAEAGYSEEKPRSHPVPPGYIEKGRSTLYDAEGNVVLEWQKTGKGSNEETYQTIIDAVQAEITPLKRSVCPSRKGIDRDRLTGYLIGDAHFGMYSWGDETGEDFDCDIALKDMMGAADRLIAATPVTETCIVAELGDFFHIDDSKNATPMNGNPLDVDSRFQRVLEVGIKAMRYFIDAAARKHQKVIVRVVKGNHDPHSHLVLTYALDALYSKDPRVEIEKTPKPVFYYQFGKNLIGITHGHAPKPEKLPGVMAVDASDKWGACDYRYIWHGHIHNKRVFEDMGVLVESFRTLAGKDAWHTEQGYRSGREMQAIVLDKDYGEVERHTASINLVRS